MFCVLAIVCFAAVPMALGQKAHEIMTLDEVAEIFRKSDHSLVPDYEVVQFQIPRRNKRDLRSTQALTVNVFGKNIKLWLNPGDGILATENTPVFAASSRQGKVYYTEIPNAMKKLGTLLVDPRLKASLIVERDATGKYSMNGFIGSEKLVVRSLPESISYRLAEARASNVSGIAPTKKHHTRSALHVIFKGDVAQPPNNSRLFETTEMMSKPSLWGAAPQKLKANVLYPEIMVALDYDSYKLHQYNIKNMLIYTIAFWNGVDLLFRPFDQPKIRFNIARIIIATDMNATPYITNNILPATGYVDGDRAVEDAGRYYFQNLNRFPVQSYDASVTMTNRKLADHGEPKTLGISILGGICRVDNVAKMMHNVALTRDHGGFEHVLTTAHELAHLLNVQHDGKGNPCSGTAGYVMGAIASTTENHHDFSPCSVAAMGNFLQGGVERCLSNVPNPNRRLPTILPGAIVDRDQQCRNLGYDSSCWDFVPERDPCTINGCWEGNICTFSSRVVVIDGAICGDGKICLHGKCVVSP